MKHGIAHKTHFLIFLKVAEMFVKAFPHPEDIRVPLREKYHCLQQRLRHCVVKGIVCSFLQCVIEKLLKLLAGFESAGFPALGPLPGRGESGRGGTSRPGAQERRLCPWNPMDAGSLAWRSLGLSRPPFLICNVTVSTGSEAVY